LPRSVDVVLGALLLATDAASSPPHRPPPPEAAAGREARAGKQAEAEVHGDWVAMAEAGGACGNGGWRRTARRRRAGTGWP